MLHRRWRVGIKIHTVKRICAKNVPPHSNVGRGVGRNYVSIHLYFGGGDGGGGGRGVITLLLLPHPPHFVDQYNSLPRNISTFVCIMIELFMDSRKKLDFYV